MFFCSSAAKRMALGRFRAFDIGVLVLLAREGGSNSGDKDGTHDDTTHTHTEHDGRRSSGTGGWGLGAGGWWCYLADGPSVLSNWRLTSQSHLPPASSPPGCSAQARWEQAWLKWTRVFVRLRAVKGVMQTLTTWKKNQVVGYSWENYWNPMENY